MAAASSRGIVVFLPLAISLATTFATIIIHGFFLMAIVHYVRHQRRLGRAGVHFWRDLVIVAVTTLLALLAHLASMTIWAMVFELCGEFSYPATAFYHSAMNYTSLGYGDIVMSRSWRLLGPLETVDGMLMFGVSTATIFAVIEMLVRTKFRDEQL